MPSFRFASLAALLLPAALLAQQHAGMTPTFSAAALDGPSSHPVSVQVTDDGGLTATQ